MTPDPQMPPRYYPQIKICGLTSPDQARTCADLGADAIGLVFYEKSPRNVTPDQAAAITAVLPPRVSAVGVFVDPSRELLTRTVSQCGLHGLQLHGRETSDFVARLRRTLDVRIYKALFAAKSPGLAEAPDYDVHAYLVECGQGPLPGGNAMSWDWALAKAFSRQYPLILAGGLASENVARAVSACLPDAVDASSSLETAPGVKDLGKVEKFIACIRQTEPLYRAQDHDIRRILNH